jgi:hypothetical protein
MFCVMICRRSVIDSASSKVWNLGLLSLSLAEAVLVEVRNENSCLDRSPVLGIIKVPFLNFVRWDGRLLGGHAIFEELVAELMAVFSDSTRLESRVLVFWRASFSWISELHNERRWWWICNRGSIKAAVVVREAGGRSVLDVCAVAGGTKQREIEWKDVDGWMEMEQMDGNNLLQGSG